MSELRKLLSAICLNMKINYRSLEVVLFQQKSEMQRIIKIEQSKNKNFFFI